MQPAGRNDLLLAARNRLAALEVFFQIGEQIVMLRQQLVATAKLCGGRILGGEQAFRRSTSITLRPRQMIYIATLTYTATLLGASGAGQVHPVEKSRRGRPCCAGWPAVRGTLCAWKIRLSSREAVIVPGPLCA
jgi:hypothetical protein